MGKWRFTGGYKWFTGGLLEVANGLLEVTNGQMEIYWRLQMVYWRFTGNINFTDGRFHEVPPPSPPPQLGWRSASPDPATCKSVGWLISSTNGL